MTPITLPGEMEGWLAQNSLARFVVEVVEQLDTRAIEGAYRGGGSAPYAPKMILAMLFYCYAKGIFTSRKIEQASYELIPVLYITGGLHPDHDSINTFRKRFLDQLSPLFVEILEYEVKWVLINPLSKDSDLTPSITWELSDSGRQAVNVILEAVTQELFQSNAAKTD